MGASRTEQLRQWLTRRLAEMSDGDRLPCGEALGKMFSISQAAVSRTIREFRERNEVYAAPRRGMFKGPAPPAPLGSPQAPRASAQIVFDRLDGLIRAGRLRRGAVMPSVKYLALELGVSPATVIAAFRMLRSVNRIEKSGRTYRVGTFEERMFPRPRRQICFFHDASVDLQRVFNTGLLAPCYRKMQDELHCLGFYLRYVPLPEAVDHLRRCAASEPVYGALLHGMGSGSQETIDTVLRELRAAAAHRGAPPPRALIDWQRGRSCPLAHEAQHFQCGHVSTSAARRLASFLVGLDARCCAFFAEVNDQVWLASAWASFLKVQTELYGCAPLTQTGFFFVGGDAGIDTARRRLRELLDGAVPDSWMFKYARADPKLKEKLVSWRTDLQTAFAEAVAADVWICSRDELAVKALQWARAEGLRVPDRLRIVGLDDDPRWYHHGITSCVPDNDANGYLLAHALAGDFPVQLTRKGLIATQARVLERLTTP